MECIQKGEVYKVAEGRGPKKTKADPKAQQRIKQMLTENPRSIENSCRRISEKLKAEKIPASKTTVSRVIRAAGYKVRRPQKKRALTKAKKAHRVELREKILGMLESGEVKLEDIWFSDETSLSVNKLGYNRRNDAVYRHEDQPMDSMPDSLRYAAKVHFAKGFVAAAAISKSGQTGRTPISVLPEGQIVDQSRSMKSHYAPDIEAPTGRGGKWARR